MATVTSARPVSADELLAMQGPGRRELIEGVLYEMPLAGGDHGHVASRINRLVDLYAEEAGGRSFAAETGFRLQTDPDTVCAPDAAYVTAQHLARVGSSRGYWPGAPDLAVEVVSPNDSYTNLHAKALHWLERGTRVLLVVDLDTGTVTRYRAPDDVVVLSGEQTVDCSPAAPGFAPTVAALLAR